MASLTPRASVFWSDSIMSNSYFPDDTDADQHQRLVDPDADDPDDDRTPLDKTIDRIGMGSYQWALLSLCGFGWMADNMWIQAVAIILPRVQQHYSVSDTYVGSLSSSMFAGMMIGAVGWGTCSDLLGRSAAFNATLFFTAVFGLAASFANTFLTLCIALFFLGSAVGGSMPTDGTLLLEHMPKAKQYLVTALSVFFSFGSVVSAFVALLILPGNSCQSNDTSPSSGMAVALPCDVEVQNRGWKYLLMTLALITLSMFIARIVFFRLHESPRYLVHAGRPHEAVKSLQMISKFNGSDLEIELDDVEDHHPPPPPTSVTSPLSSQPPLLPSSSPTTITTGAVSHSAAAAPIDIQPTTYSSSNSKVDETTIFDAGDIENGGSKGSSPTKNTNNNSSVRPALVTQYDATGQVPTNPLEGHSFKTPQLEHANPLGLSSPSSSTTTPSSTTIVTKENDDKDDKDEEYDNNNSNKYPRRLSFSQDPELPPLLRRYPSGGSGGMGDGGSRQRLSRRLSTGSSSRRSSFYEYERKCSCCRIIPRRMRRPLATWWDRVSMVLEPEWFKTTVLVWAVWFSTSLAFTMFNVYFPKLLELASEGAAGAGAGGGSRTEAATKTLEQNLWDVMIFTIGGTPGAILGAWLIESSLGRRLSLAISTFTTALFCVVFVMVESTWAVRMSTIGISLSAATMWAVLYGWTPEIFGTKVRGSACGIASALSRIGGMIAPLLGGTLLTISRSVPVYTSVVTFIVAGFCVLLLREGVGDSPDRTGRGRGRTIAAH